MNRMRSTLRSAAAAAVLAGVTMASPAVTQAAPPIEKGVVHSTALETNNGAYVRIIGDPSYGTVKFQYGWSAWTRVSREAVGYWVGVYDITRSTYVWVVATDAEGPMDLPDVFFRNAVPTEDLANGEYKVNFFVRKSYAEPVTNVAEIELEFTVDSN